MSSPSFFLKGVISGRDDFLDFQGPLSLILTLLSKNKVEIRDIQISQLLDQYLEHIQNSGKIDLDDASEFVQMASYLVYLKTRMMLGSGEETQPDEMELLMASLEQLRSRAQMDRLRKVMPQLLEGYSVGSVTVARQPEPRETTGEYGYFHSRAELLISVLSVFDRVSLKPEEITSLRSVPRPVIFGVREKSREILSRLGRQGVMRLEELYSEAQSRSELVAVFISVLELCSSGSLEIYFEGDEIQLRFAL